MLPKILSVIYAGSWTEMSADILGKNTRMVYHLGVCSVTFPADLEVSGSVSWLPSHSPPTPLTLMNEKEKAQSKFIFKLIIFFLVFIYF